MDALTIQQLNKRYDNGVQAVDNISLTVPKGEFFGLLGPNGAGKTTTIGIITSLVNKTSGKVHIFGHDLDTQPEQAKAHIGLVPQEFNFNVFEKVEDVLLNQAGFYGIPYRTAKKNTAHYLKKLGLWHKRSQITRTLSGGMKRRLMIARALVHQPNILILDEPTAGVDIELRRSTWDFLEELNAAGITIILTTHYLEEAEKLCRSLAIIDAGKVIEQTTVKSLVSQLQSETIILDLKQPMEALPVLDNFESKKMDELTLEVSFKQNQSLNDLFGQLSAQGLEILSMRNKSNRLEELFIQRVKKS